MTDHSQNPGSGFESRWRHQFAKAEALLADGLRAEAEAAYRALIKLEDKRLEGYVGVSQCARARGDLATSLAIFDEAALVYPAHTGVQMERAADLAALGRLGEAEAAYLAILEGVPEDAPALARLAALALEPDPERAYALYQRASAARPEDIALRIGVVEALLAQRRLPDALRYILALEPEFGAAPEIMARRLNLLRETGDLHAALRLGREMNASLPEYFWIWLERCNAELMLGADAEVEACLAAAPARTAVEAATVRRLEGSLAARRWQLDDAVGHYEAAAILNPSDQLIQYDLARTKILLFDLEGATASLRRFCELSTPQRGRLPNIAQTHYGQIIHECSFDSETLAELAALLFLPPAERWAALCGALRDEPGSTAVAISLMVALRQDGAFAAAAPGAGAALPKHIFQFWAAGSPPDEVIAAMQSWRDCNPEYSFAVYDDTSVQEFLAARFPTEVLLAYRRAREPAQKLDIFRLAYLAASGGIYADVHDRCIGRLSGIVPENADLVTYQEEMGTLGSNFMAAAPAQPVVLMGLQLAVTAINRGDHDIGWLATGPALLTRAMAQVLAARGSYAKPTGILILERHELFATVAVHCAANYLRAARPQ